MSEYCCKKYSELIDEHIAIHEHGVIGRVAYGDEMPLVDPEIYPSDFADNHRFNYCPYCRVKLGGPEA